MGSAPKPRNRVLRVVGPIVVVIVLAAILFPAIRAARQAARWQQRRNNLSLVRLALDNFATAYEFLPSPVRRDEAGRPLSSWRFQILPYVEGSMIAIDFADRWDAPANRWLDSQSL